MGVHGHSKCLWKSSYSRQPADLIPGPGKGQKKTCQTIQNMQLLEGTGVPRLIPKDITNIIDMIETKNKERMGLLNYSDLKKERKT